VPPSLGWEGSGELSGEVLRTQQHAGTNKVVRPLLQPKLGRRRCSYGSRRPPSHLSLGPLEFSDGPGLRNFEERPRMSSERDTFRRKADEAKQRAAQASESFMRSAYAKVAEHWMLLARLDSLAHDETITKPPSKPRP
jgi:hypothetical protein